MILCQTPAAGARVGYYADKQTWAKVPAGDAGPGQAYWFGWYTDYPPMPAGLSEVFGQAAAASMRWQRKFGSPFESPDSYIVSKYGTAAEQQLLEDTSRAVEGVMYPPIEVVKRLDNAAKNLRSGPTLSSPDRDR